MTNELLYIQCINIVIRTTYYMYNVHVINMYNVCLDLTVEMYTIFISTLLYNTFK